MNLSNLTRNLQLAIFNNSLQNWYEKKSIFDQWSKLCLSLNAQLEIQSLNSLLYEVHVHCTVHIGKMHDF